MPDHLVVRCGVVEWFTRFDRNEIRVFLKKWIPLESLTSSCSIRKIRGASCNRLSIVTLSKQLQQPQKRTSREAIHYLWTCSYIDNIWSLSTGICKIQSHLSFLKRKEKGRKKFVNRYHDRRDGKKLQAWVSFPHPRIVAWQVIIIGWSQYHWLDVLLLYYKRSRHPKRTRDCGCSDTNR